MPLNGKTWEDMHGCGGNGKARLFTNVHQLQPCARVPWVQPTQLLNKARQQRLILVSETSTGENDDAPSYEVAADALPWTVAISCYNHSLTSLFPSFLFHGSVVFPSKVSDNTLAAVILAMTILTTATRDLYSCLYVHRHLLWLSWT